MTDGRAWSIWDAHAHTPGRTDKGDTGDIACDHYHRFKEDVQLMADMGISAYRFSISWSRVQPDGQGAINEEGIKFYSDLIDELLLYGITPWVTLYHWDLPLSLQMEKDGWYNIVCIHTMPHTLYHTIQHHTTLCHTIPYYTTLYHTIPHHTIPHYTLQVES